MTQKSSSKIAKDVINLLDKRLKHENSRSPIPFNEFLGLIGEEPYKILRNIFQLFSNMIYFYIDEEDEYESDPENIGFKTIHCERLLVEDTDIPFFADLPLANRLLLLAESFKEGSQQNKIYVFIGPPGSGKSTFLTNLLQKFQKYTCTHEGAYYELVWRLDSSKLGPDLSSEIKSALEEYYKKTKSGLSTKNSHF